MTEKKTPLSVKKGLAKMISYADVGDEGMEEGEREPSLVLPVCKS